MSDSSVNATELAVQQPVAKQAIHRLDVVLDVSGAVATSSEQRERRLPAEQQRLHYPDQSGGPCCMANYCSIFEPP
jgi:hypothetical protein